MALTTELRHRISSLVRTSRAASTVSAQRWLGWTDGTGWSITSTTATTSAACSTVGWAAVARKPSVAAPFRISGYLLLVPESAEQVAAEVALAEVVALAGVADREMASGSSSHCRQPGSPILATELVSAAPPLAPERRSKSK